MTSKRMLRIAGAVLIATALSAHAQYIRPTYQYPPLPDPENTGIHVADTPMFVHPYIGLAAGRDDNVLLKPSNELASKVYIASPGLKVDARSAGAVLQAGYQGQYGHYVDSSSDNYYDHTFNAQADVAFDRRNFLRLGLAYVRAHEPRGSTDRPVSERPDKYELLTPGVTYAFGAPGAQGRIELYFDGGRRRYLNNREITASGDRDTNSYGGAFFWRAMPKTYLLVEGRETRIRYQEPAGDNFSADERRFFGGVAWEATAATTGTFKIGRLKREFVNGFYPDETSTSWEALVTWAPRTYSKFDLFTTRTTSESTGLGSFVLASITGVTWNHAWNSRLSTAVDLRYEKDEYQDFSRTDDIKSLGLRVGYKFRRWLTLGAEYTRTQRDSNLNQYDYDKNIYLLTATASM